MKKGLFLGLALAALCAFGVTMRNAELGADDEVVVAEEDPNVSLTVTPTNTTLTVKGTSVDVGMSNRNYRDMKNRVDGWEAYWNGTNAWLQITNYMHLVAGVIPEFSIWEIRDGVATNVWSDLEKFDAFINQYRYEMGQSKTNCFNMCTNEMHRLLADKADRAWSLYNSGTGEVAPEGTTWVSTPVTVLAGGLEYERHVTTGGAIWVLKSNGLVSEFGNASTNSLTAYFTVSDDQGNSMFSIKKTDSFTDGATHTQFSLDGTSAVLAYRYRNGAPARPTLYFKTSLDTDTPWIPEGEAGFPYTVTPRSHTGTADWVLDLEIRAPYTVPTQGFFKGEYTVEGETIIENSVPTKMQYIVIGKPAKKYSIAPVTISGQTVLGLTEVN